MRVTIQVIVILVVAIFAAPIARAASAPTAPVEMASLLGDDGVSSLIHDVEHMPPAQLAAIGIGAAALGYAAETLLEGGVFTVVGVVIGAALGNQWFERGYWPF